MNIEQEFADSIYEHLHQARTIFYHSPSMWSDCDLPVELNWEAIRFTADNRDSIPPDQFGVYAFILQPEVIGPPESKYLLYIGKTENSRRFQRRYSDYLRYVNSTRFARPKIAHMLKKWYGHIWFYYASIEDVALVDEIETSLMNACIPPGNVRFKGSVGTAINAFRRDYGM